MSADDPYIAPNMYEGMSKVTICVRIGTAPSFYVDEWIADELAQPIVDELRKAQSDEEAVPMNLRVTFSEIANELIIGRHLLKLRGEQR